MDSRDLPLIPLGSKVNGGYTVGAVLWLGERYYMMTKGRGDVALMPADSVELDTLEASVPSRLGAPSDD